MAIVESSVGRSPLETLIPASLEHEEAEEFEQDQTDKSPVPEGISDKDWLLQQISNVNVARDLPQDILDHIGRVVTDEYQLDKQSRADWEDKAEQAMKYVLQDAEPKQYPFP